MSLILRPPAEAPGAAVDPAPERPSARTDRKTLLWFFAGSLVVSVFLYQHRWSHPGGTNLHYGGVDQNLWEWFFAVVADKVAHVENPLFTHLQNEPDGVNLMANTAMFGLSIPLAPLTWLFGPGPVVLGVVTAGLALTATAWCWLLLRWVVPGNPGAAVAGAIVCGFGPGVLSHAVGPHPNWVFAPLLPLILDRVLRLCHGERVLRNGAILGLLTTYQIFLGQEILLLTAVGAALFAAGYVWANPRRARTAFVPLAKGLGVGGAITLVAVAYPLYWQFWGPQHYGPLFWTPANKPQALVTYPSQSIGGDRAIADALMGGQSDQNAAFGWATLGLAALLAVVLWKHAVARGATVLTIGAAVLSLGADIPIKGSDDPLPGPWGLLEELPLFHSVIPNRFALLCLPGIGILVALAVRSMLAVPDRMARTVSLAAIAAVFVPLIPTPFRADPWPATPAFISDGTWREYLEPGGAMVTFPTPSQSYLEPLHWQVEADLGFSLAGGYFVGPSQVNGQGTYGAPTRPVSQLIENLKTNGSSAAVTDEMRRTAAEDFAHWGVGVVVVPVNRDPERQAVALLLGRPGELVGGVWVWRIDGSGRAE